MTEFKRKKRDEKSSTTLTTGAVRPGRGQAALRVDLLSSEARGGGGASRAQGL